MHVITRIVAGLFFAALVHAQTYEIGAAYGYQRFSKTGLGSLVSGDREGENSRFRGQQSFGGYLTLNTRGYYGHELSYFRHRADFSAQVPPEVEGGPRVQRTGRTTIHQGAYNFLIYFMPRGERWRPYITGGIEMVHFRRPQGIPEFDAVKFRTYGGNYGGGIKLMPVKHVIIRFDVRDHITGKPYDLFFDESNISEGFRSGGLYRRFTASAGVSIGF